MSKTVNSQRIKLTAQQFKVALQGVYRGVKKDEGKGYWEDDWGNIIVENIELIDDLSISITTKDKDLPFITIINSETKNLKFDNSTIGGVEIINSTTGELIFNTTKILFRIDIRDNTIVKKLHIDKLSTVGGNLKIENNTRISEIELQSKELRKVTISHSNCGVFSFGQDTFCNLSISNCEIDTLQLVDSIIPKDSIFQIVNTTIKTFNLERFINFGLLHLVNIPLEKKSGSTFNLINSDLGKTNFISCDLERFDKFVFLNTKMLDVFIADTELPKKSNEFKLPNEVNKKERNAQQRLAYSQFKKISFNRGDNVLATEFLALEIDAYAKQIFFNLLKKPLKLGELINIGLNKISSNHGNNWFQAVIVTLIVNSLCFWWYCHNLGYILGNDYDLFRKLASFSLEFLNPLRKADFLKDLKCTSPDIPPFARVVDYVSRIIIAYFTYQTIQAFRRFGQK